MKSCLKQVASSPELFQDDNSTSSDDGEPEKPKSVRFDQIQVLELPIILGDNPSISNGVPVTLDWTHQSEIHLDVERFEEHRPSRRSLEEMKLNVQRRLEL